MHTGCHRNALQEYRHYYNIAKAFHLLGWEWRGMHEGGERGGSHENLYTVMF